MARQRPRCRVWMCARLFTANNAGRDGDAVRGAMSKENAILESPTKKTKERKLPAQIASASQSASSHTRLQCVSVFGLSVCLLLLSLARTADWANMCSVDRARVCVAHQIEITYVWLHENVRHPERRNTAPNGKQMSFGHRALRWHYRASSVSLEQIYCDPFQ